MELGDTINRVKQLISQREAIEAELQSIFGGQAPTKRTLTCSICQSSEHTARKCPQKPQE
jgi:hypothetical protein